MKKPKEIKKLIKLIKHSIREYEGNYQDYCQEFENEEQKYLNWGKVEALNDVLRQINIVYDSEKN